MRNLLLSFVVIISFHSILSSQMDNTHPLYNEVLSLDSILFEVGFNQCRVDESSVTISDNFEFYHDQAGITNGKKDFVESLKNNICSLSYRPWRKLVEGSTEVFPLFNNGRRYGLIQRGIHEFYAIEEGKEKYLTSTARFTHLWILEDGEYKLRRVLSFDHHSPE